MATIAYTRTGDKGTTRLITGEECTKDSARTNAYGDVDELNSLAGLARARNKSTEIENILDFIQNKLFELASDLAAPVSEKNIRVPRISDGDVGQIEKFTDEINAKLPEIKNFVVFANSETAAALNCARSVCRRAERKIVRLAKSEEVNEAGLRFANRLSSLLFVLARYTAKLENKKEVLWKQN